jgi:hypothetical protein
MRKTTRTSSSLNRTILGNGIGAYRTSDQVTEGLLEYNRRFPSL